MAGADSPELQFPAPWRYRVVVEAGNPASPALLRAVLDRYGIAAPLQETRCSGGGKYRSYHIDVLFESRAMMEALSRDLQAVDGVRFLL